MGIKSFAAQWNLRRQSRRLQPEPVTFPLTLTGRSLLVLLPMEQRHLTVVKQVLPDIVELFGDRQIHLLAYPGTDVQSIFPTKGLNITSPPRTVLNWQGLPSRSFLETLHKTKFEYVFDANLEDNLFAARVLLEFPKAVRFGCSGRLGAPFFNLEIKTKYMRDRRLIYSSILEVVAELSHVGKLHDSTIEEQPCT
jgi:hypothetical protein